jgi:hypothetical protein
MYAFRAAFSKWSAMRDESKKRKKNEICATQQKVFFIWGFQYTSVSVGKGVRPSSLFFFGLVFSYFLLKKKRRTVISALFWNLKKKGGSRWWEFENTGAFFLFFCWALLVSLKFRNFFAEFWFATV